VALDSLAGLKLADDQRVTWDGLRRRRDREPGSRGCRKLEPVLGLSDPRAESAMETRLRTLLVLAGLPTPEVQFELVDEWGFVVARFDLAYPEELLAVEYDGRGHTRREYSFDDRRRDGTTGDHGWHTMRFGYDDVMLSRRRTVELVRNQLTQRSRHRR
jgi:very-short-patch-repair endonuclease